VSKFCMIHSGIRKLSLRDVSFGFNHFFKVSIFNKLTQLVISAEDHLDFPFIRELELVDYNGAPFKRIECPKLEKIHLKCTTSIKNSKIVGHILQLVEHSPRLTSIHIYVPSAIFSFVLGDLKYQLSLSIPYITYTIIEYIDNKTKRLKEELYHQKLNDVISECTTVQPNSLANDLLRAFE